MDVAETPAAGLINPGATAFHPLAEKQLFLRGGADREDWNIFLRRSRNQGSFADFKLQQFIQTSSGARTPSIKGS